MVINVHAGHNPSGAIGCGAVGILDESRENRIVKDLVINKLRNNGHTVYDCTVEDGANQNDVLNKIVQKCNSNKVDLDISIHFNSGRNDYIGDGSIGGTEVFCYSTNSNAKPYARKIVENISSLGFRIRDDKIPDGIKTNSSLYVLKKTNAPAMLIECCFVDDADDARNYNAENMSNAIVNGIIGTSQLVATPQPVPQQPTPQTNSYPIIKVGSVNGDVGKWQNFLLSQNYKSCVINGIKKYLKADNNFGAITESITERWQGAHGLVADGIVGTKTWTKAGF